MRKLPSAGDSDDNELDDDPSNDTGIGSLGLISEFGFAFLGEMLA